MDCRFLEVVQSSIDCVAHMNWRFLDELAVSNSCCSLHEAGLVDLEFFDSPIRPLVEVNSIFITHRGSLSFAHICRTHCQIHY